jgi:hypothetical protein
LLFFNLAKLAYRQAGLALAEVIVPAVWVCLVVFVFVPLVLSVAIPGLEFGCTVKCR